MQHFGIWWCYLPGENDHLDAYVRVAGAKQLTLEMLVKDSLLPKIYEPPNKHLIPGVKLLQDAQNIQVVILPAG